MKQTPNFALELYELDDMANLDDGYNSSMRKIDTAMQTIKDEEAAKFPVNTADIANGAVTTAKIATAAVTTDKIDPEFVSFVEEMQLNGAYEQELSAPAPFSSCKIHKSANGSFFFLTGFVTLNANTPYSFPMIPGTDNYGIKLTNTPLLQPAPTSPMNYPNTIMIFESGSFLGTDGLAIGTDGNLYMKTGTATLTPTANRRYAWLQSKLTLTNLSISPTSDLTL